MNHQPHSREFSTPGYAQPGAEGALAPGWCTKTRGCSITPYGTALDLGWCIMRPIDERTWLKVLGVVPHWREFAKRAAYAGLTWRQYLKLSLERQEDLRLGSLWMSRQFDPPQVGRPVIE